MVKTESPVPRSRIEQNGKRCMLEMCDPAWWIGNEDKNVRNGNA